MGDGSDKGGAGEPARGTSLACGTAGLAAAGRAAAKNAGQPRPMRRGVTCLWPLMDLAVTLLPLNNRRVHL